MGVKDERKRIYVYEYNIWRLITTNGESLEDATYLGWYTEGGEEWDDYSDCNFGEYLIIESHREA